LNVASARTNQLPAASALSAVLTVYRLNTRLLLNCLSDMTADQATVRPNAHTNHALFVALHLLDTRFLLGRELGLAKPPHPFRQLLEDARSIDEIASFPEPGEFIASWTELAPLLETCLGSLTEAELSAIPATRFPVDDVTVRGMLAFLMRHESYHIGQMALLRKYVGLPGMKYS
jgi:hypothetical protein